MHMYAWEVFFARQLEDNEISKMPNETLTLFGGYSTIWMFGLLLEKERKQYW